MPEHRSFIRHNFTIFPEKLTTELDVIQKQNKQLCTMKF